MFSKIKEKEEVGNIKKRGEKRRNMALHQGKSVRSGVIAQKQARKKQKKIR